MWTTAYIRRQLARMTSTKPFSIREFLGCGKHAAVDQTFGRLVKNGEIIRIARGLYIKANSPAPTVKDIALAKAAAFKRTLATHGVEAAALKIMEPPNNGPAREYIFAASGSSSSFRCGEHVIRFIGTAARKLHLGDSKPGLVIRALWHLGERICTMQLVSQAVQTFGRIEMQDFRMHPELRPEWMEELFQAIKSYWESRQRLIGDTVSESHAASMGKYISFATLCAQPSYDLFFKERSLTKFQLPLQ